MISPPDSTLVIRRELTASADTVWSSEPLDNFSLFMVEEGGDTNNQESNN
jgi:hypothetical protein